MKPLLLVLLLSYGALAWDTAELDMFDLVEELQNTYKQTFYEFLSLDPSCTTADVRRAYKKLALVLHPDKNDAPDADIQFRVLAGVYEVLKDKELREKYDRVLVEGLPSWKSTAFYFRRMRKIGLAEGLLYLFSIATFIQYCVNWAAYMERKFTISENMENEKNRKLKKLRKTGKNEEDVAQEMADAEMHLLGPPPTCFDTLPFQMLRAGKGFIMFLPTIPGQIKEAYDERKRLNEEKAKEQEEWEEEKRLKEEEKVKKKEAKAKRKTVTQFKEATDKPGEEEEMREFSSVASYTLPRNAGQMWTDPDLVELARLIKKIPGGSNERWERIAEVLERTAAEVTKMAAKIKNNPSIVPKLQGVTGKEEERLIGDECLETEVAGDSSSQTEEEEVDEDGYVVYGAVKAEEYVIPEEKKKKKTKGGKLGEVEAEGNESEVKWSQEQQKCLEMALTQYPKGSAERWERIAAKVEGMNKEQCMIRFKYLAEQVKKKKAEKAE